MLYRFVLPLLLFASSWVHAEPLAWFDRHDRPSAQARQALEVLSAAQEQGLDPRDYGLPALAERVGQAQDRKLGDTERAQLDAALTGAVQRYLSDLQNGRVDPRSIHAQFDLPRKQPIDTAAFVREALADQRVGEALRAAEPRLPMYAALKQSLAQYRALSGHAGWQAALPAPKGGKLTPGKPYAQLPLLAQRLQLLGDLPAGAAVPARYEGALVDAVKRLQERHGLDADGVIGTGTLQALNTPPAERARQIELAMERLRWTPLLQGPRMIVVNVPEFVLRAYEVKDGRIDVKLRMKVIVGKSLDTRTPLFDEDMRHIEFSPYWNVPPSIARAELIPRFRRDPGYFYSQGFEFVTGSGQAVNSLAPGNLDAVESGAWRIRQRPGPKNALGDVKFVFPNNQNIYLHHTPTPGLFAKARRDLSHGCIRVEHPVELARFVLQDQPEWTEARIHDAMDKGKSSTVKLSQPLPVLIAYSTVVVEGGRTFFYADLYGHDKLLDQALRQRSGG
jgi:murein L,D-transpeptidase YcbB/YkuD